MRDLVKRRLPFIHQCVADAKGIAALVLVHLHGRFLALVPEPPAPLIGRLMNSDSVKPGLQARLPVEAFHSPKDLEKHLLGGVGRVGRIAQNAVHEAIDRLVIMRDQPGVGVL